MTANYPCIAHDLRERLVDAVETPYVTSFHASSGPSSVPHDNEGRRAVRAFHASLDRSPPPSLPLEEEKGESKEKEAGKKGSDDVIYTDLLRAALNEPHDTKDAFSSALFGAMATFIQGEAASSPESPWASVQVFGTDLVLEYKGARAVGGFEYATGLARRAAIRVEKGCCIYERSDEEDDQDADKEDGISTTRLPNSHLWVMYRRPHAAAGGSPPTEDWAVWKVLAVVDLKRGIHVGALTQDRKTGNVDPYSLFLHEANYPIAPAIMYTLAYAVPGNAALGGGGPSRAAAPSAIPFAVFSCKTDARQRLRTGWIHGNLVTPQECGHRFDFNIDAYGPLHHRKFRKRWTDTNVAAYLHVMRRGLDVAHHWLEHLARGPPRGGPNSNLLPVPNPMSGRELQFGRRPFRKDAQHLTIISNAVLVATPALAGIVPDFRMTKGELFRATVNLHTLRSNLGADHKVYWCLDAYPDAATSVLFKVSSRSCFNVWVPNHSRHLLDCMSHGRYWDLVGEVRAGLSQSLYGMYRTSDSVGLVQLLPDWHVLGYAPIPDVIALDAPGRSKVWRALAALVRDVLIPLALQEVVHYDLRVVGSHTRSSAPNLLYHPEHGSMRLVDLDCLCHFESLGHVPRAYDPAFLSKRYLPDPLRSATGFVLGQVICAAEAWLGCHPAVHEGGGGDGNGNNNGTAHVPVRANDVVERAVRRRVGPSHVEIFDADAVDGAVARVDEALLHAVLDRYEAEFDRRARTCSPADAS
jgi:hypothetical protein